MKRFTLKTIGKIIDEVIKTEEPTGNEFLDNRYEEQRKFAGGNTLPYYRIFYRIAEKLYPSFIVELGSFQATAAAHFAGGAPKADVVTIDKHTDPGQDLDELRCKEAQREIDNLYHIKGWTWDTHVVEFVKSFEKPIDILYIDAWHRRDYVEKEWETYEPLLADKALIICDDLLNNGGIFPEMEEWWDSVTYEKLLDSRGHMGIPMGYFIYSRS